MIQPLSVPVFFNYSISIDFPDQLCNNNDINISNQKFKQLEQYQRVIYHVWPPHSIHINLKPTNDACKNTPGPKCFINLL